MFEGPVKMPMPEFIRIDIEEGRLVPVRVVHVMSMMARVVRVMVMMAVVAKMRIV